ncbi:MAG TPA: AsmA-like C-terminal domain-containing protein [Candidatus Deferrimicrobiaceae bacterium]
MHRKIIYALAGGAGILLALLAALFLLAPRLINTAAIKDRALALLERETGVRLSYARAEITLFPRPRVAVRGVGLEIPGVAQGTAAALEADPAILPLLRGQVRIGNVLLETPDFRVRLPAKEETAKPVSLEEVEKSLSSLLETLRQRMPGTVVTIRNARLELSDGDGPIVTLREAGARLALPPDRLTVHVQCASQYWEGLTIDTSVHPEGLRAETRIEAAEFRIRELADRLAPGGVPWLGETVLSLRGRIDSEGLRSVKAEVTGAVPALTIRRGSRSRVARVRVLKAALDLNDKEIRAALSDLALDEPRLRLSGDLSVDRVSPRIEVRLTGQGLAIAPVRDTLLALAGDVPTVRDVLDIVREGDIQRFTLRSEGRSAGELGDQDALRVQATLSGGSIHIPGPGLTLEEVGAEVTIAGGILDGKGIAARLGTTRATGGSLRMGLEGGDPPFHAEFQANAEAAEAHSLLPRLVADDDFRGELARIREIRGDVAGKVVLGERLSSIDVRLHVSKIRLAAEYERIPFPVAIDGGEVAYDGTSVAVKDLRGKVGKSSLSDVNGRVELSGPPALSVRSGRTNLDLGELYPWVASFEAVGETASRIRSLRGILDVESLSLGGPLRGGGEWTFDAAGSIYGLELDTPVLPGSLSVPTGRFRIRPESVSFSGVEASLPDTSAHGDLELVGYRRGSDRFAASFEGKIGPETAKWAYERIGIPEPFRVKAPYTVTGAEISREGEAVQAKFDMRHPAGPTLSFSAVAAPGKTTIDPLVIRSADSDATLAVELDPGAVRGKYAGTLSRVTLEKILPIPALPGQRIRGEMEAVIDRGKPSRSSVHGTLSAAGVTIPWEPLAPLAIRDISLEADGRTVRVLSSALAWDNVPFSLTGTAEFGGEEVVADLDLAAGDFDAGKMWRSVKAAHQRAAGGTDRKGAPPERGSPKPAGPAEFPLQGAVRLRADSITLDRFSWRPVRARAQVKGNTFRFAITEANLCGISMTGSATLGAGEPSFELVTSASGEEVNATIDCLTEERVALTGEFGMSARLAGEGVGETALRSLHGPVEVEMRDGRIRKMTLLSSILELLNVTDLLRGKFPDFRREGFAYKTLVVRGEAKDGKFTLREAAMDAPSMQLAASGEVDIATREADIKVLIAPLGTVDAIVRRIPVLGYILGNSLVSVPVTVKGDLRDPKVTAMDPGAVGAGLLGIFTRTLKTPVHVISPYLPGKEKKAAEGVPPPAVD